MRGGGDGAVAAAAGAVGADHPAARGSQAFPWREKGRACFSGGAQRGCGGVWGAEPAVTPRAARASLGWWHQGVTVVLQVVLLTELQGGLG